MNENKTISVSVSLSYFSYTIPQFPNTPKYYYYYDKYKLRPRWATGEDGESKMIRVTPNVKKVYGAKTGWWTYNPYNDEWFYDIDDVGASETLTFYI